MILIYFFKYETIETNAHAFSTLNILSVGTVRWDKNMLSILDTFNKLIILFVWLVNQSRLILISINSVYGVCTSKVNWFTSYLLIMLTYEQFEYHWPVDSRTKQAFLLTPWREKLGFQFLYSAFSTSGILKTSQKNKYIY